MPAIIKIWYHNYAKSVCISIKIRNLPSFLFRQIDEKDTPLKTPRLFSKRIVRKSLFTTF